MKCGEICARSARTSASASRARDASSSASSTCADTQRATSVVVRARTAVVSSVTATRVPTTRSSTTIGATTNQVPEPSADIGAVTAERPVSRTEATCSIRSDSDPGPSPERTRSVSVSATPREPSSVRRCREAAVAASGVSPSRSAGAASDAVCSVAKVARSASLPRSRRWNSSRRASARTTSTAAAAATIATGVMRRP